MTIFKWLELKSISMPLDLEIDILVYHTSRRKVIQTIVIKSSIVSCGKNGISREKWESCISKISDKSKRMIIDINKIYSKNANKQKIQYIILFIYLSKFAGINKFSFENFSLFKIGLLIQCSSMHFEHLEIPKIKK
jgi:hypothetical protein